MTNDTNKALPTLTDAPELHPLPHDWAFDADFVRNYACAYGQRCYERGQTVERALSQLSASSEEIERGAATTREAVRSNWQQFQDSVGDITEPIERLRYFCSLALSDDDWLDVEPLFDALAAPHDTEGLAPADALVASEREQAPTNSLPDWDECSLRVRNSDDIATRVAEGGYGPSGDEKLATELHRFIYEYDDADPYRSAWFMHRLELTVAQTRRDALEEAAKDISDWRLTLEHVESRALISMAVARIRSLSSPPAAQSDREGA